MTKRARLNLGNGDLIALAAALRLKAEQYGKLLVPTMRDNLDNAQALFATVPQIEVFVVSSMSEMLEQEGENFSLWRIPENVTRDHYAYLYHVLDLPYETRWVFSPIPQARMLVEQIEPPIWPYQLIHEDASRGFVIRKGLRNGLSPYWMHRLNVPLLAWCKVIENAAEVHLIDSAPFHLALHCNLKTDKLFLHQEARPYSPIWQDYDTGLQNWTRVH